MKNKLITGIIVGILLMGIVFAFSEGQIFTQEQVDGFDVDTITWQTLEGSKTGSSWKGVWRVVDYDCLILEQTIDDENLYEVFNGEFEYYAYTIFQKAQCLLLYGYLPCRDYHRSMARQEGLATVEIIKDQIRDYQTVEDDDDWFDDWPLFE